MSSEVPRGTASAALPHHDVVVIGAGISGLGAARYVRRELPGRSWTVLEARETLGGTWSFFRYPGIRSDSDLFTFGYAFRPWRDDDAIASAEKIVAYLRDTARDEGIDERIEYGKRVIGASWSSPDARWTLRVQDRDGAVTLRTCSWIFSATGYYRYDQGHTPTFEGIERYRGRVVHPQHWPDDLDVTGRRLLVIGSGATAITIVPALAETAAHVTQLQRTPTYVIPVPKHDVVATAARRWLGDDVGHSVARRNSIMRQRLSWRFCQRFPRLARQLIRWVNVRALPPGFPVDEHFRPPYAPWDQRLCVAPDGDYFRVIRDGRASIVTDRIRGFTETGVELESGRTIDADIVVTATGLQLLPLGGVEFALDGQPVKLSERVVYRGIMLNGVPNFAFAVGYTNSSWTLKVGLLCEYFVRLSKHMDENGWAVCRPELPPGAFETRPFLDFGAGYVQRSMDELPRQGGQSPWLTSKDYFSDVALLRRAPVQDGRLVFLPPPLGRSPEASPAPSTESP